MRWAAGSLVLREWTLRLLCDEEGPSDTLWAAAAACDPRSWAVFLTVDGCALTVQSRMDTLDGWPRLSPEARATVKKYAIQELVCVLSARAQIRTVARLAEENGWTTMILKGGAAVAQGAMIDLNDVDILVAPEHAADFAAALDSIGFQPLSTDSEPRHHLSGRADPDALTIEVHRRIKDGGGLEDFLPNAIPLSSEPPLLAMGPVDTVRYLLRHATVQHPERIGRLRDLLLIAHTLRSCTQEQIEEIETTDSGEEAAGMLRLAQALAGRATEERFDDPFSGLVLRRYIVYNRWGHWFSNSAGTAIVVRSFRLLGKGWATWWTSYGELFHIPADATPAIPVVKRARSRSRFLGNAVWLVTRHISFGLASAIALMAEVGGRWIEARSRRFRRDREDEAVRGAEARPRPVEHAS